MKLKFLLAAGLLLAAFGGAHGQSVSAPVTNTANGHVYYLLNGFVTWNAAEAIAVGMGGHLATIRSSVENQWLGDTFRVSVGVSGPLWIGVNDRALEGTFQWTSGEPVLYTNWEPGQPDDGFGLEDAGFISLSGQWSDSVESFVGFVEGAIIEVIPAPPLLARLQVTTNATISWNSQSNLQYQVQYSTLLTSNSWLNLGSPVTATGTNSSFTDLMTTNRSRFYRIVRLP